MNSKFEETRFDHAKSKIEVHRLQYNLASRYLKANALVISGPAVVRHIQDARKIAKTPKSKITIIEQDPEVFEMMQNRFNNISPALRRNVSIIKGDVYSHKTVYRFEDLDLCKSLKDIEPILLRRLGNQKKNKSLNKCVMFTSCLRGSKTEKDMVTMNYILSSLGAEMDLSRLESSKRGEERRMRLYAPPMIKRGRLIDFRFTTYRDGSPMRSCVIIYK